MVESELETLFAMTQVYLNDLERQSAGPGRDALAIWLAAWFHLHFVNIHPFLDGNGRTTRALTSIILLRLGLLPMLVTTYDQQADDGDLFPLASFISRQQTVATLVATSMTLRKEIKLPITPFRKNRVKEVELTLVQQLSTSVAAAGLAFRSVQELLVLPFRIHEPTTFALSDSVRITFGSLLPIRSDIFVIVLCENSPRGWSIKATEAVTFEQRWDLWARKVAALVRCL
ncbi:hypothetical protein RQP46_010896 [Phenoliferia psychrophenolica]